MRSLAAAGIVGLGLAAVQPLQRYLLDSKLYPMAQAIDGTYGAFYFGEGSGANANDWVFYFGT